MCISPLGKEMCGRHLDITAATVRKDTYLAPCTLRAPPTVLGYLQKDVR